MRDLVLGFAAGWMTACLVIAAMVARWEADR